MIRKSFIYIIRSMFVLACILMVSCTTEVELCEESHPHKATVTYSYDWSNVLDHSMPVPEGMDVYLNRIVHSDLFVHKYYEKKPDEQHRVETGTYKFFTLNRNSGFDFSDVDRFIANKGHMGSGGVTVKYNLYDNLKDAGVPASKDSKQYVPEFEDDNIYFHADEKEASYVKYTGVSLAADSCGLTDIDLNGNYNISFKPHTVTQNIDLYFDIRKDVSQTQFTVDSVYCILAGVPRQVMIQSTALDVSTGDKIVFKANVVDANTVPTITSPVVKDTLTSTLVRLHKNLDLLGIVQKPVEVRNKEMFTGVGVIQLSIYSTYYDEDHPNGKRVLTVGLVNMDKALDKAQLQVIIDNRHYKARDHSDVYLPMQDLKLTPHMIVGDDNGGIKDWQFIDTTEMPDLNFDI